MLHPKAHQTGGHDKECRAWACSPVGHGRRPTQSAAPGCARWHPCTHKPSSLPHLHWQGRTAQGPSWPASISDTPAAIKQLAGTRVAEHCFCAQQRAEQSKGSHLSAFSQMRRGLSGSSRNMLQAVSRMRSPCRAQHSGTQFWSDPSSQILLQAGHAVGSTFGGWWLCSLRQCR